MTAEYYQFVLTALLILLGFTMISRWYSYYREKQREKTIRSMAEALDRGVPVQDD